MRIQLPEGYGDMELPAWSPFSPGLFAVPPTYWEPASSTYGSHEIAKKTFEEEIFIPRVMAESLIESMILRVYFRWVRAIVWLKKHRLYYKN